ncbi:MAG: hypothetical protein GY694_22125, partial [Gammaproteobacteria bacterium]|nr:hypothetical protein [Gammaproteobacteria bacterium]
MIATKKSLCCDELEISGEGEFIFCKLKIIGRKPLVIGSFYRPPENDLNTSIELVKSIYNVVHKNKNAVFWLGGDFNLPDINWIDQDIHGNQYLKSINSLFLEMSQDLGLSQIINFPSRGDSVLDLLFTNTPDFISETSLLAGLGDHDLIKIKSNFQPIRKKPIKRRIHLWNRADETKIRNDTQKFRHKFSSLFTVSDNPQDMWDFIKPNIDKIIEDNVDSKLTSSKTHQPWITTETKRMIRKKNRWFSLAKKSKSSKIWNRYKEIRSETQRVCRRAHDKYVSGIFKDDTTNKKMWSYIKSKKQEHVSIPDIKDKNNTMTSDPQKKAQIIHEQFDSVYSDPTSKITPNFDESERLPTMPNIEINYNGILKLLQNINPNKAVGPDQIPGKFLKLCCDEMAFIFQTLFQASIDQGIIPSDWKEANITPLFKKGDRSSAENYRPISLTSVSCKLLEHVVHTSIMSHFDNFDVLDNAQHGFRKKRSCISQLVITINDFANCLKNSQQIDAILLDFSKAFDKVDHEGLILKLEHLGIRNSLLLWIRSFLIGRRQRVVIDGTSSPPTNVLSGVPQGTVLGPLFFLVYINDISKGLSKNTFIRLFADDSLLYRVIKTSKDAEILQKDLETLQCWEKKWKMEFHPHKCQLLRITNKINPIKSIYKIHDIPVSETNAAKYLGVLIDS